MFTDKNFDILESLTSFAEARDHTILELAFSWLLANKAVSSVIAGATKVEQVIANSKAASWNLTTEEVAEVNGILGAS
jgi:aryl-alcohol dehydrogenase-like predicted oxidoreductase